MDGLHRHLLADHRVLAQIDDTHSPLSQLRGELVVTYDLTYVDHMGGASGGCQGHDPSRESFTK